MSDPQISIKIHGEVFLDQSSKDLIQKIKKSPHIYAVRRQTQKLVKYWRDNYLMKEMIVDIKELNYLTQRQKQIRNTFTQNLDSTPQNNKYLIELYPNFHRISSQLRLNQKCIHYTLMLNMLMDPFNRLFSYNQWKFKKNQYLIRGMLETQNRFSFIPELKFGKPINQKWVSDCSKFMISKKLPNIFVENQKNRMYVEMKGYHNRIRNNLKLQPGIFVNKQILKYQDTFEMGLCSKQVSENNNVKSYLKFSTGTSLISKTLYYKLKLYKQSIFNLVPEHYQIGLQSKFSFVDGFNLHLLPQELINRRQRWIDERSTAVLNIRANIYAIGNKVLNFIGVVPYNYVSFWASDNFSKGRIEGKPKYFQNVKLQGEVGIGLKLSEQNVLLDISLLRANGNPYRPKFGFQIEF